VAPRKEITVVHRILLADDQDMSRAMTERVLRQQGFEVVTVADGAEAVALATRERFDLVLMDCQMPVLDGYKATQAIRQHEGEHGSRRVPIVGLSARAMDGDEEAAIGKGMDAYVTKPFTSQHLRETVAACIAGAQDA
jgi:CheY-like chemotaxis protein